VRVEDLRKSFHRKGGDVEVLKGISFDLRPGETAALVGVSGAGKTTLLQIVGTLDRATSGRVFYGDREVFRLPEDELAAFRNRTVGFVFQFHHLLPEFDARENVMLPCLIGGMSRARAAARAEELLAEVGLALRARHRVGELSGGEQQRVALCRALAMDPAILLADEPTGNLDRETALSVADLILSLNRKRGLTVLLATHNEELAARMGRVLRISDGRIAA